MGEKVGDDVDRNVEDDAVDCVIGAIEEPSSLFKYAHGLAEKHCSPGGHSSPTGQGMLFGQFSM